MVDLNSIMQPLNIISAGKNDKNMIVQLIPPLENTKVFRPCVRPCVTFVLNPDLRPNRIFW